MRGHFITLFTVSVLFFSTGTSYPKAGTLYPTATILEKNVSFYNPQLIFSQINICFIKCQYTNKFLGLDKFVFTLKTAIFYGHVTKIIQSARLLDTTTLTHLTPLCYNSNKGNPNVFLKSNQKGCGFIPFWPYFQ